MCLALRSSAAAAGESEPAALEFVALLASLLQHPGSNGRIRRLALSAVARFAARRPLPALRLLPVLLARLGGDKQQPQQRETDARTLLKLLLTLPELAAHSACVAPVLR